MHILFVNQAYPPDLSASARYLEDCVRALASAGNEVTVLTSDRGYLDPAARYPRFERAGRVTVRRIPTPRFSGRTRSRALRILDALGVSLAFAAALPFLPRVDRVVSMTSPPLVSALASFLARRPRRGRVCWVLDLNPDQAIEAGWLAPTSLTARALTWLQRATFRRSDLIVVLDRFMRDRIVAKGIPAERVAVFPLWNRLSGVADRERNAAAMRERFGVTGKFVVMYSGNMSVCHPLETILEAAHSLRSNEEIAFVFIGGGARAAEIVEFRERHGLRNLSLFPYVPERELAASLSAADLHLVSLGDRFNGIVHPSKIYEIVAAERRFVLVGPRESFIGEEFIARGLGHHVDHGDSPALAACIERERTLGAQPVTDEARRCRSRFRLAERTADFTRLIGGDFQNDTRSVSAANAGDEKC